MPAVLESWVVMRCRARRQDLCCLGSVPSRLARARLIWHILDVGSTLGQPGANLASDEDVMGRIPIAGPWITEKEVSYVTRAVRDGWYDNAAKYQGEFEQAFASFAGRRYGISLPSCTSGLHLALLALGIGPGDEVVVPDVTWIATSAPISYVGATPVFADVDRASWCITADSIAAVLTP